MQDLLERCRAGEEKAIAMLVGRFQARALRIVTCQCLLPRTGGKGRVAAYGVLVPDEETRRAITEGADPRKRATPPPAGSRTLAEDIERLRKEGVVSEETAAAASAGLGI